MNYAVIDLGSNSMRLCCLIPRIPEFTKILQSSV